ncbi:unnamed protein product [Brassica rapa]|uniref:Uncharacterized protein n=2 Tax=Brassica TaxID=3705 RepID=A0A8D9LSB6_BRACM|nr:unnamed protein product [Brassica napus]CAG7885008.1 unnamed protein product [Brassica rapa]
MFRKVSIESLLLLLLINYLTQIDVSFAQYSHPSLGQSQASKMGLQPSHCGSGLRKPISSRFMQPRAFIWTIWREPCNGSGDMSAAQAVAMWIDEKSYYDYY